MESALQCRWGRPIMQWHSHQSPCSGAVFDAENGAGLA